tara:strand:+ start:701 stop:1060 length:360 start_codon:yes stop_codon:yes gene_type:complete
MKYDLTHALLAVVPNSSWAIKGNSYSDIEWQDSSVTQPTEDVLNAKIAELDAAEPLRLLREERDKRIAVTDWRASGDLTMPDAWKTYRQALRDMTTQTAKLNSKYKLDLTSVTWPTEPS